MLTAGIELLKKTAVQSFWNTYFTIPDPFDRLVYIRPSTQSVDTYARLGAAPMPQQWTGDKEAKVANEYIYAVANLPYEGTVKIDKSLIKFQQWDEVANLVGNLGSKARDHKTKLLSTILATGISTVGDDGQFFFDTDHADPGAAYTTAQDNDRTSVAATGTQPTDLEMAAALRTDFAALWGFKDDRGDPAVPQDMDAANYILMVPPVYLSVALQVQTATSLTGPIGNDMMGRFTTRVNPFLTAADQMFLIYAGSNHKPFIIQEAGGLMLEDDTSGDAFFRSGNVSYSASWWGAVTYGQWRVAVSHIFS